MNERGVVETTFPLIPLPFHLRLRRGLQIGSIVFLDLIIGLFVGDFVGKVVGYRWPCMAVGAGLGFIFGIASARPLCRAACTFFVTVNATHLQLLRWNREKPLVAVSLEKLRSIEERGKAGSHVLLISAQQGVFPFPWVAFDAGMLERLRDSVRTALALLPRGAEFVAAMEHREQMGRELVRRRPKVVHLLLFFVCIGFVVELARRALDSPVVLLSLGGNAPVLVADGQWWRLLTANFLHASWLHIYLNCVALVVLGLMLERLAGALQMLVISLVAGIAANIVSALGSTHVYSLGVSGMVFGMIGALLVVNLRSHSDLPAGFHIRWTSWAFLLGLNGLISLLPVVDALAHLGGLIGGSAAAFVLVPKDLSVRRTSCAVGVVGALLALAYISAVGTATLNATGGDARADFLHAALDNSRLSDASLNNVAWQLAIDPATDAGELAAIERTTTQVVDRNPHNSAWRDTYAYVLHREGRGDQAFEQERIALIDVAADTRSADLYTMFLRFLLERKPADPGATTVERHGGDVVIESPIPGAVIFATSSFGGLVRIILAAGVRRARVAAPRGLSEGPISVRLVDGAGPEPRTFTTQISFAPWDDATARLP